MSADGVIPEHGPGEVGLMEDIDGVPVGFSLNLDGTVRITIGAALSGAGVAVMADLDHDAREQFQRLFMEAERRAEAMDAQVPY